MSLLPSDLIADATQQAYPYISENALAPGPLLRHLSVLDADVVNWFSVTAPERLSTAGADITVVLATNPTGYALTTGRSYYDFRWIDKDGNVWPDRIRIVPESQFLSPPAHPAGIVRGSTFFPCDDLGLRWTSTATRTFFIGNGDTIAYRYMTEPVRITALSQALISPDEARDYLQWSLVMHILLADVTTPPERVQIAMQAAAAAKQQLLLLANKRTLPQSSLGRGVI